MWHGQKRSVTKKPVYGKSLFVSLPASRDPAPNSMVKKSTLLLRANLCRDFMVVVSGSSKLLEESQEKVEIKLLLSKLPNLLPEPFLEVVKSSKKIVTQALQLSPRDTSRLMHSVGVTYSTKRQLVTVLGKLNSFSPFAGEKRQREYEKEAKYLLDNSKVEKGAMLLWKTALADTTSPCPYVRVTGLDKMVWDLVVLARRQTPVEQDSLSMLDLDNPR